MKPLQPRSGGDSFAAFEMMFERPAAAFGGSPPREGETRAKRARGSLTHHLETFSRGYTLSARSRVSAAAVKHVCRRALLRQVTKV
jgi:hypothetical protein